MSAPRANPTGMINVTSTAQMQGKLMCYGYGQDPRVINPGDLVIVCLDSVYENAHRLEVEFALRIRGRDMNLFSNAASEAELLWDENRHWLNGAVNAPRLDMRAKSEIRSEAMLNAIDSFYNQPN